MTSVGIEPMTSGLDLPLLCRLSYEVGQRKSGAIKMVNRGEEKAYLFLFFNPFWFYIISILLFRKLATYLPAASTPSNVVPVAILHVLCQK